MTAALTKPVRPLVKVCGLTRVEDVELAAMLGAWAVGFIFAPSPRMVTPDAARRLMLPAAGPLTTAASPTTADPPAAVAPLAVGVFGDTSAEIIVAVVAEAGLGAVQLHGAEPDVSAVKRALAGGEREVLLIKTIAVPIDAVDPGAIRDAVAAARAVADLLLFDTAWGGRSGGTGLTFPWEVARAAAEGTPYLVAGGIGPENAHDALESSGAWGVDVSSGVEAAPGLKDHESLRALFASLAAPRSRTEGSLN